MSSILLNSWAARGLQATNIALWGGSNIHKIWRNWQVKKMNTELAKIEYTLQSKYPLEIQRLFSYYVEYWISSLTEGKYCSDNIRALYNKKNNLSERRHVMSHSGIDYLSLKTVTYITIGIEGAHQYSKLSDWASSFFSWLR